MSFEEAKSKMIKALDGRPMDKADWEKVIRAAEDVLRSAGVRA